VRSVLLAAGSLLPAEKESRVEELALPPGCSFRVTYRRARRLGVRLLRGRPHLSTVTVRLPVLFDSLISSIAFAGSAVTLTV
jgi:hypothetical protein